MSFEKHLLRQVTTEYHGLVNVSEPTITTNGIMFLSDGSGGLASNDLYLKTTSGLVNLSAAGSGTIAGGANVGAGEGVFKDVSGTDLRFKSLVAGTNVTLSSTADEITINATGGAASTYESITTSVTTAIDETVEFTEVTIDNATPSTTLADGTVVGQKKSILIVSSTGTFTVNVTTFVNGSSITFDTQGQSVDLVWSNSGWIKRGVGGIIV